MHSAARCAIALALLLGACSIDARPRPWFARVGAELGVEPEPELVPVPVPVPAPRARPKRITTLKADK